MKISKVEKKTWNDKPYVIFTIDGKEYSFWGKVESPDSFLDKEIEFNEDDYYTKGQYTTLRKFTCFGKTFGKVETKKSFGKKGSSNESFACGNVARIIAGALYSGQLKYDKEIIKKDFKELTEFVVGLMK
jgi:hypothetical protein